MSHWKKNRFQEKTNPYEGQGVAAFVPLLSHNNLNRIKQQKKGERVNFGGDCDTHTIRDAHIRNKTPDPVPLPPPIYGKGKAVRPPPPRLDDTQENHEGTSPEEGEIGGSPEPAPRKKGRAKSATVRGKNSDKYNSKPRMSASRIDLNSNYVEMSGARGRAPQPPGSHMIPIHFRPLNTSNQEESNSEDEAPVTVGRKRKAPTTRSKKDEKQKKTSYKEDSSGESDDSLAPFSSRRSATPSRRSATPSRRSATPSRRSATPSKRETKKTTPRTPVKRRKGRTITYDAEDRELDYGVNGIGGFPSVTSMINELYVPKWDSGESANVPDVLNESIRNYGFADFVVQAMLHDVLGIHH